MRKLLVLVLVFFGAVSYVQPQEDADILPVSTIMPAMTLTSSTNGQDYSIYVGLPWGYDASTESYPVLYLLDPVYAFGTMTDHVRLAAFGNELPKMIVVGIGYPANVRMATADEGDAVPEYLQLRDRDYAEPGADGFLEFLVSELIPLIDATYRTNPTDRTIAGGSQGGAFVFYALENATDMFGRYVAYAPTPCTSCELQISSESPIRLAIQVGDEDMLRPVTESIFSMLESANFDWLEVSLDILEDTTHLTGRPAALNIGLKSVFCTERVGQCTVVPVGE